jgi:hypothetical protein
MVSPIRSAAIAVLGLVFQLVLGICTVADASLLALVFYSGLATFVFACTLIAATADHHYVGIGLILADMSLGLYPLLVLELGRDPTATPFVRICIQLVYFIVEYALEGALNLQTVLVAASLVAKVVQFAESPDTVQAVGLGLAILTVLVHGKTLWTDQRRRGWGRLRLLSGI